jgi:hypothetical protein
MGPFVTAWLIGEGIMVYRSVKRDKAPPGPGQLLIASGIFILLAIAAQNEKARPIATTIAYGFDIAAFLGLYEKVVPTGNGGLWPPATLPDNITYAETVIDPSSIKGLAGKVAQGAAQGAQNK